MSHPRGPQDGPDTYGVISPFRDTKEWNSGLTKGRRIHTVTAVHNKAKPQTKRVVKEAKATATEHLSTATADKIRIGINGAAMTETRLVISVGWSVDCLYCQRVTVEWLLDCEGVLLLGLLSEWLGYAVYCCCILREGCTNAVCDVNFFDVVIAAGWYGGVVRGQMYGLTVDLLMHQLL